MGRVEAYLGSRHVVVTGGSSGIGKALAAGLVAAGAEVTLIARRAALLESAAAELRSMGPEARIHTLPLDVARWEDVEARLGGHLDAHPADVLINNAGVALPGRFLEMDLAEYRRQMEINYFGAVHTCRVMVPRLVEGGGGHITNVGSIVSVMGIYGYSAYAPTKFALYGFSECLRAELWPHGISVSVLLPPDTDTPQHTEELAHLPPETKAIAGNVKMLDADTVARTCLEGMAAKRFEIVPGVDGRVTVVANRFMPGLVRWFCDRAQTKAEVAQGDPNGPRRPDQG